MRKSCVTVYKRSPVLLGWGGGQPGFGSPALADAIVVTSDCLIYGLRGLRYR